MVSQIVQRNSDLEWNGRGREGGERDGASRSTRLHRRLLRFGDDSVSLRGGRGAMRFIATQGWLHRAGVVCASPAAALRESKVMSKQRTRMAHESRLAHSHSQPSLDSDVAGGLASSLCACLDPTCTLCLWFLLAGTAAPSFCHYQAQSTAAQHGGHSQRCVCRTKCARMNLSGHF